MFFAVTGYTNITHNELRKNINEYGHHMGDFVNEKTDYLIANSVSTTRKYLDAIKYNIPIITEEELMEMLNAG